MAGVAGITTTAARNPSARLTADEVGDPAQYDDSLPEPDEVTWAKFAFTIQRTDGGIVDAELIRPRSWIQANGIRPGHALPMHIEELQIDGEATVTSIESCPPIAAGDGSAVTGRFVTRQVDEIAVVKVLGPNGQIETIEGTTIHPVWSVDQQDWIGLGDLEIGETLSCELGPATVLDVQVKHESTPVFNIEIHGEHVYQVGELGLLVHNAAGDCVSRINESPRLVTEAENAGRSVQAGIDSLTAQLRNGNLNPGTGSKSLGSGISYARGRGGARVYFRETADGTIEILGKSNKGNQSVVIDKVLELFG